MEDSFLLRLSVYCHCFDLAFLVAATDTSDFLATSVTGRQRRRRPVLPSDLHHAFIKHELSLNRPCGHFICEVDIHHYADKQPLSVLSRLCRWPGEPEGEDFDKDSREFDW